MKENYKYTGIYVRGSNEEALKQAVKQVTDPIGHQRREAQRRRDEGAEVEEVVLEIGSNEIGAEPESRRVLSFDEFEQEFMHGGEAA